MAWLDESYGSRALAWVRTENQRTVDALASDSRFERYAKEAAAVLTDPGRLPVARQIGDMMYNYWQSEDRPLGVWRRTSRSTWLAGEPAWTTVLDIDELAETESKKWIFAGADCLESRCLISLADNGKDAHVVREFDLESLEFIDNGFALPEDKSSTWWIDQDRVLVATSAGGGPVTESRLPKSIRLWRRGSPLKEAKTLFEGGDRDASIAAALVGAGGRDGFVAVQRTDFFKQAYFFVSLEGTRAPLPLPDRLTLKGVLDDRLLFRLGRDWMPAGYGTGFRAGDLMAISLSDLLFDRTIANAELLYRPGQRESVRTVRVAGSTIYVELLRDYRSALIEISEASGGWRVRELPVPRNRFVSLLGLADQGLLLEVQGLLEPGMLVLFDPASGELRTLYARSGAFDTAGLVARMLQTKSRDGTTISYTIVHRQDLDTDGSNPTLVYGYGGFDVSITPRYEPVFGKLWLEKGGVYVHAYLRGGGENGPGWHSSAMLKNRQQPYDDMIAVVEDLHRRGIASPGTTGIMGRSNGGLMVAAVMMQRPELLGAVVVGGPLIDMLTYHLIPPGASWTAEYGDPRNEEMHEFIETYSPLQQIDPDRDYPRPLIITSTDDDRVLPGHARRFAAALSDAGHERFYFEDEQGGHYWELAGGPAPGDWRLRSVARAVEFAYLSEMLFTPGRFGRTEASR